MTNTPLIISSISIHQDAEGRYSLNDLHKAAGSEDKHKPAFWLRSEQTNELVEEILKVQICTFNPVDTKKGRYGGTYVCKELVYSYAMWISAAFSLKVIRAYDDLVNGRIEHPECKKKSLPGKITADQQEAIKQLVLTRGKSVPQEHQAKATITLWSALKSHFGCTYKEISEEQFTEALSLAARVPLEGEFISRQQELPSPALTISYPADWFIRRSPYIAIRQEGQSHYYLDSGMLMECPSPALGIMRELSEHGYDVTAASMEINALRHIMEHTRHILGDIAMMADKNRRAGLTFRV